MNSEEILDALSLCAKLLELHEENPFKIRSIGNAAFRLSKSRVDLESISREELEKIDGIGKGIADKIIQFRSVGSFNELEEMLNKTPAGVIEMLGVKGIGPKKVRQLWKELEIESLGELYYACCENRLVDLKGFGSKTQESIRQSIEFTRNNSNKWHYATAESVWEKFYEEWISKNPEKILYPSGEFYRKCEIIERIDLVHDQAWNFDIKNIDGIPLNIYPVPKDEIQYWRLYYSGTEKHREWIQLSSLKNLNHSTEKSIYTELGKTFIEPELREGLFEEELLTQKESNLIQYKDLKGVLHNHTTYSDGANNVSEMAEESIRLGFEYLGICDHSQSAFYAGGLKPESLIKQREEIQKLNSNYKNFKIFYGIESDILNTGELDYPDEILNEFDFIVASVHSNLKMNEEKANARIIKAIENPHTRILGHPTGRLLLARPAYPLNHKKIIDACAANNVVIELNAHPYRLDIDWRWIPYCLEKNVMISINPDAHHISGLSDMRYGVNVARKGLLKPEQCLNSKSLIEFEKWCKEK